MFSCTSIQLLNVIACLVVSYMLYCFQFNEETTSYKLKVSLHEVFPWLEYIVRCGWLPDGKRCVKTLGLCRLPWINVKYKAMKFPFICKLKSKIFQ